MVNNPSANAGDTGSIPGSGKSPREGNGNPLQCSCLGNSKDRGAWWATIYGSQRVEHGSVPKQQQYPWGSMCRLFLQFLEPALESRCLLIPCLPTSSPPPSQCFLSYTLSRLTLWTGFTGTPQFFLWWGEASWQSVSEYDAGNRIVVLSQAAQRRRE